MPDKVFSVGDDESQMTFEDMRDGTHAERVLAHPPFDLLTDGGDGPHRRLRVDSGQTGFFAGREFRTFQELAIAAGASAVIRATVPSDIILFSTSLSADAGIIRMGLFLGGEEGGAWSPMPVLRKNTMAAAPNVAARVALYYGGMHAGGTLIDVVRLVSSGIGSNGATVGGQVAGERGVGPGTYYYRIENNGNQTANVVFSAFWEERA